MRTLRTIVQTLFLTGVVAVLVRGIMGSTASTCETYCPFAGLVAVYPLLRDGSYTCSMNELHVSLFVSLVALTLVTKKSFCSWVCPLGAVQEWVGRVGRKVFGRYVRPPVAADRVLLNLKYVVLVLVLGLTWTVWEGDLGFRAYDPFYIIFTGFQGHGTLWFSIFIGIGVLIAAFFLPMMWCRYLCPLSAVMDPMSRVGILRLGLNHGSCTDCGVCDDACPHGIPVSSMDEVTARDCTNCLECVEACPEAGTLALTLLGK